MSIRIVVDSTADIPADFVAEHGITIVPAYVNVGEESWADDVDISRSEFYRQLPNLRPHPTTAAPPVGVFTNAYQKVIDEGATAIISIHLASVFSSIYNSARLGAQAVDSDVPIHLIDSRQLTLGGGWLSILAAEAVAAGQSVDEILAMIEATIPRIYTCAVLDDLNYLRRSGRANWAQFGLGTLLQIKPVMFVHDGELAVSERVRTRKRSLKRIEDLVASYGPLERLAIIHAHAPEDAELLRGRLQAHFPAGKPQLVVEVAPTIGVHVGPQAVGYTCIVAPK
ncbi:MAG TPA: DegV family protein [Anaerolineae bacterium]|nr:DegV family protein [Anaerolineae bacterium]